MCQTTTLRYINTPTYIRYINTPIKPNQEPDKKIYFQIGQTGNRIRELHIQCAQRKLSCHRGSIDTNYLIEYYLLNKRNQVNHTKDIKFVHYTHFCSDIQSLIKTLKIVNKFFPYSFKWKYIYNEVDGLNTAKEQPTNSHKIILIKGQ